MFSSESAHVAIAGRLGHNSVHAAAVHAACRGRTALHRGLGEQKSALAEDGTVVFGLRSGSLASLALLVVATQSVDHGCLLRHVVDHERHGKVAEVVAP